MWTNTYTTVNVRENILCKLNIRIDWHTYTFNVCMREDKKVAHFTGLLFDVKRNYPCVCVCVCTYILRRNASTNDHNICNMKHRGNIDKCLYACERVRKVDVKNMHGPYFYRPTRSFSYAWHFPLRRPTFKTDVKYNTCLNLCEPGSRNTIISCILIRSAAPSSFSILNRTV